MYYVQLFVKLLINIFFVLVILILYNFLFLSHTVYYLGPVDINNFHNHINNIIDMCETGQSLAKTIYGDLSSEDRRFVKSSLGSIATHMSDNQIATPEGFKVYLRGYIPNKTSLGVIVSKVDLLRPYDGS